MRLFLKYNRNLNPETIWRFVLINIHYQNTCQVWSVNIVFCNVFFQMLYEKDGRFTQFIEKLRKFHFHNFNTIYIAHENKLYYTCTKCNKKVDVKNEKYFQHFYRRWFCKTNYAMDFETMEIESQNATYN